MMRDPKQMRFDPKVDADLSAGGRLELNLVRELVEGNDVLNVGCWTGEFEYRAAGSAGSMTAIDVEPKALEVARNIAPSAEFIEASVFELPFSDQSFDLVTMWAVIEHIPVGTEQRALKEVTRVLRHGGHLAITTPSSHWLSKLFDPAYFLAGHRHYSPTWISSMLDEAGLSVERIELLGSWYSVLSILAFYVWKYLFRRQPPDWDWLARSREKDEQSPGFNLLFALASRP